MEKHVVGTVMCGINVFETNVCLSLQLALDLGLCTT